MENRKWPTSVGSLSSFCLFFKFVFKFLVFFLAPTSRRHSVKNQEWPH